MGGSREEGGPQRDEQCHRHRGGAAERAGGDRLCSARRSALDSGFKNRHFTASDLSPDKRRGHFRPLALSGMSCTIKRSEVINLTKEMQCKQFKRGDKSSQGIPGDPSWRLGNVAPTSAPRCTVSGENRCLGAMCSNGSSNTSPKIGRLSRSFSVSNFSVKYY